MQIRVCIQPKNTLAPSALIEIFADDNAAIKYAKDLCYRLLRGAKTVSRDGREFDQDTAYEVWAFETAHSMDARLGVTAQGEGQLARHVYSEMLRPRPMSAYALAA